jgi:hypothetical protein
MPAEILTPHIATPFYPRFGQWVAFKPPAEIAGSHLTPDGLTVGIFTRAQRPNAAVLAVAGKDAAPPEAARLLPARIMVVDVDGCNLPKPQVKGQAQGNWWFTLDQVSALRPITDREHLPPGRDYHPDFVPQG